MIVSELLQNFNQYNAGVDTVEIVTNDYDFGGLVTIDILSIDNLMNEPEFVDMRIATIRRWWLKRIFTADIHPHPYNMELQIVIEV